MTSKEALDKLSLMINREKHIDSDWNKKIDDLKQIIKQDLDKLEKENQGVKDDNTRLWHGIEYANNEVAKLKDELKRCQDTIKKWMNDHKQLIIDNGKMKKALDILKEKFALELGVSVVKERYCYSLEFLFNNSYFSITKKEYELLKSVLEGE